MCLRDFVLACLIICSDILGSYSHQCIERDSDRLRDEPRARPQRDRVLCTGHCFGRPAVQIVRFTLPALQRCSTSSATRHLCFTTALQHNAIVALLQCHTTSLPHDAAAAPHHCSTTAPQYRITASLLINTTALHHCSNSPQHVTASLQQFTTTRHRRCIADGWCIAR
jgi:hypothetical protein